MGRCGLNVERLKPSMEIAREAGWSILFWDWAFICARPQVIERDERGRLHCLTGPAVKYPDGFGVWAVHGVRVPQYVIETPAAITVADINGEANAEVRRVKIERFGAHRYLLESGAKEIHADDFGTLYRRDLLNDEPLVMVKVVNSTPEADGSFKDYFLRVPPAMRTAREAVAWTFGKSKADYQPAVET